MLAVLQYNFPVFSAVLLLTAGILIGYALWIPFRGDTEGIIRQLRGLREQNEDLEVALKQQRDAYVSLERSHAEQQDEWTYLRTWNQRVEKALEEQGLAGRSIEQGLAGLQDLREHALRELEIERQRRTELEDSVQQSQATADQLRLTLQEHEQLKAKYDQLEADLGSLQQDYAQQASQHELQAEPASDAESENLLKALEEQRQRADELSREQIDILAQLQSERELRSDLEEVLKVQDQELQQIAESQDLRENRQGELEEQVTQAAEESAVLAQERDRAVARLDAAHEKIAVLRTDLDSHRRAFDTIERHRAEMQSAARRDTDALHVALQEREQMRQELEQFRAEQELARTIQQQHESLQRQYKALQDGQQADQRTIAMLKTDRDETAKLLAVEREQREELARHLEGRLHEAEGLRQQREEVLCTLREEQAARRELAATLEEQTRRLQQVSVEVQNVDELHEEVRLLQLQQAQSAESSTEDQASQRASESAREMINSLQLQLAANQQSIQTLKQNSLGLQERYDDRIEQLTMERNAARQSVELAEEKMAELQRQMEQLGSTVAELRREREDVLARLRRQTVMLENQMVQDESPATDHRLDETEHDERAA